ncbi:MAG: hypothetical protein ABI634_06460 [Acidobacteriota bacterium]
MHKQRGLIWLLQGLAALLLAVPSAQAQIVTAPRVRPSGRISFYVNSSRITPTDGPSVTMGDFITNVSYTMPDADGDGVEYGLDVRHAASSDTRRAARISMYDGYVGGRFANGHVRVRGGQMWLNDLGGLGAVSGAVVEYKQGPTTAAAGRLRVSMFAGTEPKPYELGSTAGIRKMGGYGILEGNGGRRHVAGYVRLADRNLIERSVLTTTNFVPIRSKLFFFQAAEYDLVGPAGQGTGGLTYLMVNAHASPTNRLDLQGLYHRGRSLDTRSITEDVLAGRPLRDGALDALLYASAGARVSVHVARDIRLQAGYTRDKNNRDSADTGRISLGVSSGNVAGSGVDVTVTDYRISRPTGQYNSVYLSVGRQIGRAVYLSGDYSSSVSIVRFTRSDGITVETRPETTQIGLSAVVMTGRHISLSVTADTTHDNDVKDVRVLAGMTYRFR